MTSEYVDRLVSFCPEIREVWLIGSRANGTATNKSDWDYLVFGDEEIMARLGANLDMKRCKIDILVVYDRDTFRAPWPRNNGKTKYGSLNSWKWRVNSSKTAQYSSAKEIEDQAMPSVSTANAIRVWPA